MGMDRKTGKNLVAILRVSMLVVAIALQFALLFAVSIFFSEYAVAFTLLVDIISAAAVLNMGSPHDDPSFRIAWLIIVLILPILGLLMYLLWGRTPIGPRMRKHIRRAFDGAKAYLPEQAGALEALKKAHPARSTMCAYQARLGSPAYANTDVGYYAQGEDFFDALAKDMENARRFIFLEFFIIDHGEVWARIYDILWRKAKQGVKVRLLYDDVGCLFTLKRGFDKELRQAGIEVMAFSRVNRYVSEFHINYRDHQKIAVIDGDIGYAGGVNLADEYANLFPKFGHWKDTALRLEGEGVWSLTHTFLRMWDLAHHGASKDYAQYMPTRAASAQGFVQPIADGPANNPLNPIENLYRQMLMSSRERCLITTPYLVLNAGMSDALRMAAQSGVDVRIYTPGTPDHWYVHPVSQSFYAPLLREGVRIFEYTPGFLHAKMVVSDDDAAIVGSVNMDFRSFYLHYENAVLMVGSPAVKDVAADILKMESQCNEITLEIVKARPWTQKALGFGLRVFTTLM